MLEPLKFLSHQTQTHTHETHSRHFTRQIQRNKKNLNSTDGGCKTIGKRTMLAIVSHFSAPILLLRLPLLARCLFQQFYIKRYRYLLHHHIFNIYKILSTHSILARSFSLSLYNALKLSSESQQARAASFGWPDPVWWCILYYFFYSPGSLVDRFVCFRTASPSPCFPSPSTSAVEVSHVVHHDRWGFSFALPIVCVCVFVRFTCLIIQNTGSNQHRLEKLTLTSKSLSRDRDLGPFPNWDGHSIAQCRLLRIVNQRIMLLNWWSRAIMVPTIAIV